MKQLSALGVRRQFYRNPRRLRALRPGEELDGADLLGQHAFNYFVGQSLAVSRGLISQQVAASERVSKFVSARGPPNLRRKYTVHKLQ